MSIARRFASTTTRAGVWPLGVAIVLHIASYGHARLRAQGADLTSAAGGQASGAVFDPARFKALAFRSVGPHRGGRVTAVTGVRGNPATYYMGSTGGGVWKTDDAGQTWNNISDAYFDVGPVGSIAVAPSNPAVIYAGTGSACIRGNVSIGKGIYKSTDGGQSWRHSGLRDAGQIGRIRVHPKDANRLYVAALGNPFGRNPDRGVFRSRDGGATWEKVLFINDTTGAVDLSMDARNPDVLYAAIWRAERKPWTLISGSLESGIYKTTDGGTAWKKLGGGLPTGLVGKIGVAVSPADPTRVYAVVEAAESEEGVFRSNDAGATWTRVNDDRRLTSRPWYYNHIFADPKDANTFYSFSEAFLKSTDGGKTLTVIEPPHGDNHDLWINPDDPQNMIQANDGGANVTFNGGRTWSPQVNQPTVEFYTVTVDNAFPYRIYGPQQDNSTLSVPSRAPGTGITLQHWLAVGGCETGPIAVRPDDPDIVYAGCYGGRINRFNLRTGQSRQIMVHPAATLSVTVRDLKYRFQWNAPILISPHDARVLYHASQYVHRTLNEGQSWEIISPDLTRDDKEKQGRAGEPITNDMTGVEVYNTIFALAESPHRPGEIWAGSNDGLVHVTRDGGTAWANVTPKDLPVDSTVNSIDLSAHQPGRAFVAAYHYRMNDWQPYLYRTDDYGQTWTRLTTGLNGIPADHPTRVVREDPTRKGLLYAGTEFGLFVSFDDGASWQSLQLNLPHTPVTDLAIKEDDLIVATQGRSFWVLDDLGPLREWTPAVAQAPAHLFRPGDTYRTPGERAEASARFVREIVGGARLPVEWAGQNPVAGATLYYAFAQAPGDEVTVEILDGGSRVVRRYSSAAKEERERVPKNAGLNRFVWDLRYPRPNLLEGVNVGAFAGGPVAVPGPYQVRLTAGAWSETRPFRVQKDPRIEASVTDLQEQFDLMTRIGQRLAEAHDATRRIRAARERLGTDSPAARELAAIENLLVRPPVKKGYNAAPQLSEQLNYLATQVSSADARPTDQSHERLRELEGELRGLLERVDRALQTQ